MVFCKKTRAKRLADTVFFKHKYITQPTVTPVDAIVNALTKLGDAIQGIATMRGNLINYPDDVGVPTDNLLLIKIFLNSIISMKGAEFANANLANFYLMSLLKRPEYA